MWHSASVTRVASAIRAHNSSGPDPDLAVDGNAQHGPDGTVDSLDEELTMLIGPARDGAMLEIGILDLDGEDPVVIHAMALRSKFRRFLR